MPYEGQKTEINQGMPKIGSKSSEARETHRKDFPSYDPERTNIAETLISDF